jgi:hypothetical protein
MDEALALDLIALVNQAPKDQDAPTNLNNACVVYEKLFKFGEATKCYERLARDYPQSNLAKDAVWNAARNHRRFFNFDKAVVLYQLIATDPGYAQYEHRKDALGLAAQLLDNDQQYGRAADFYKRYSDAVMDKPVEAAEAHYRACQAYEKLRDTARTKQCLLDLNKRFGSQPAAGKFVVQSFLKLAATAEASGKKKDTLDAYRRVRDEFVSRHLPPASEEAGAAAKAEFLLTEEKFTAFKAKPLKFTADQKQVKRTFDTFTSRRQGAGRRLPAGLGLQGRHLDPGLVPAHGRRLLRVRPEDDQGRRRSACRRQGGGQEAVQAVARRLRHPADPVQGRHPHLRHARSRTRPRSSGRHPRARLAAGRHQRVREEGAREPVEVPAGRVPVHQGRAHRRGVPMSSSAARCRHHPGPWPRRPWPSSRPRPRRRPARAASRRRR